MLLQGTQLVAAVQYEPVLLGVNKNLATGLQLSYEAAAKGAKLIVLPELCTSGQVIRNSTEAVSCAQERDGYQTEAFRSIAATFGCHVVFGYVELCDGKLYNSAAVVGPQGLAGNFQKHNLWGSDNLWATPSMQVASSVLTAAGRTGVLICRDAKNRYRESYTFHTPEQRFYRRGDVDTICLLTNWGESYGYPDSSWVELAEEAGTNVVVSNRIGEERDMKFKGGACIIDRDKKVYTFGSSFTSEAVVGGLVLL